MFYTQFGNFRVVEFDSAGGPHDEPDIIYYVEDNYGNYKGHWATYNAARQYALHLEDGLVQLAEELFN